jgi:uridylate kinase
MLATIINALSLQSAIERAGMPCRVLSAIPMTTICEPYIRRRALRHLEKKRVVIFAAGTGNPFFTTDTAAVLRAIEMGCDLLFKGTQVDGVYNVDPRRDSNAKRYDHVSYKEAISDDEIKVMDASAVSLAMDNDLPIVVYKVMHKGMLLDIIRGGGVYTSIGRTVR